MQRRRVRCRTERRIKVSTIQRTVTGPVRTGRPEVKPRRGRPRIQDAPLRILTVAAELFAQKEFHRVSTEEVAERAGTGKGTVYRHFPSKEVLYVGATIFGLSRLRNELKLTLRAAPSARAAVELIVRRLLAYFWEKRDFFFLLRNFAGLPQTHRRRYESERRKLSLLIRETLAAGIDESLLRRDLNVAVAVEALLGMVRAVNRARSESVTLEEAGNAAVALFLYGCIAERATTSKRCLSRRTAI
jgi:AcrR family transcriptional regulator